ncbi:Hsp70 nucleotide exchange factor fes1 [Corynespora cassiicola Philippines]|uniref:Hsp70 nucleotide exchange factor fes1 n=1 Tax=Corynespora cassiicola Philippines TaxID=1448308 RepID=A0A2T2NZ96_CORCC|nr:Hsp70 nucleotide exchange factor fes1 [Corynespora cassiicola Philippines]
MNDPNLNTLLKWGIENSDASKDSGADAPKTKVTSEALAALMNMGHVKSQADMMLEQMALVEDENIDIETRCDAFENFSELVEQIDNANNMPAITPVKDKPAGPENPDMWTRLLGHLQNTEDRLRMWAAASCSAAVQNNIKSQERLLINGGLLTLVKMATEDPHQGVRKKAVSALSSAVRNFQPGLDTVVSKLPTEHKPTGKIDANDMESVNTLINGLREKA